MHWLKKRKLLKWWCTKNSCTAMIYSGVDENTVIQTSRHHNHDGNSPHKIQRQVLRENCKRQSEESISSQPLKIIRTELLNSPDLTSIVHNDFKTVRKAIYDRRRKILPELPKSLIEVLMQLHFVKIQDNYTFNKKTIYSHS